MVTHHNSMCISVDADYAVSTGCQGHEPYSYQYAKTLYTYTDRSTTGVTVFNSPTSTFSNLISVPTIFEPEEWSEYWGLYADNVITLLPNESGLEAAATATATAIADPRSGTAGGDGTSETTSNAAPSLRR